MTPEQQTDLQQKAAAFIVALATVTDARDAAWEGVQAVMAYFTATGDATGAQLAVTRLRKLNQD